MNVDVDSLHVKRNRLVGMNYLGIIDTTNYTGCYSIVDADGIFGTTGLRTTYGAQACMLAQETNHVMFCTVLPLFLVSTRINFDQS